MQPNGRPMTTDVPQFESGDSRCGVYSFSAGAEADMVISTQGSECSSLNNQSNMTADRTR